MSEVAARRTEPGTVLALEFRAVPHPVDLSFLGEAVGSAELVRVDPLEQHVRRPLTLGEQAQLLAARVPASLRLVVTHCGTAALGLHVAAHTGAPTLLLDPYPVTAQDMRRDFARLCAGLEIDPPTGDEPDLARWEAELLTTRSALAELHGGDEEAHELVDDLLDRYRAWLRFLLASMTAAPVAPTGQVTVVAASPSVPLGALLSGGVRPRVHVVTDVGGTPDSPAVRAIVSAATRSLPGRTPDQLTGTAREE